MNKFFFVPFLILAGCAAKTKFTEDVRHPSNSSVSCPEVLAKPDMAQTAYTNLSSFDYVHEVMNSNSQSPACVTSWPLSRNNYGYHRFLFLIDSPGAQFTFLYQDASVQAHHNVGKKSWVALDPKATRQILLEQLRKDLTKPAKKELTGLQVEKIPQEVGTFFAEIPNANPKTISVAEVSILNEEGVRYDLGVVFEKVESNIFSKYPKSHTYFIQSKAGRLSFYKTSAFELESKLDALLKDTARHQKESGMSFVDYLQKISQVGPR